MFRIPAILFSLLLLAVQVQAQRTIKGKIVSSATGEVIAGASVFISNSSMGTVSDRQGNFELSGIPDGQYELIISFIGYETNVFAFNAQKLPLQLRVEMDIKVRELENVTVEPSVEEGWDKWGRTFTDYFVGRTPAAAKCKIKNEKAIRFRYYKKSNRVVAYCDEPVILENRELGYTVRFQLEDFEVNFKEGSSRYSGYPFFEEIDKKRKGLQNRWQRARDKAYYGSVMHFLRSLWKDSLAQNGFEVRRMMRNPNLEKERVKKIYKPSTIFLGKEKQQTVTITTGAGDKSKGTADSVYTDSAEYYRQVMRQKDYIETYGRELLTADSVFYGEENGYKVLLFSQYLHITYKNEVEDEQYLAQHMERRQPAFQQSYIWLIEEQPVAVYPNGSYYPPNVLFTMAYWSWDEKMANCLPIDYEPSGK